MSRTPITVALLCVLVIEVQLSAKNLTCSLPYQQLPKICIAPLLLGDFNMDMYENRAESCFPDTRLVDFCSRVSQTESYQPSPITETKRSIFLQLRSFCVLFISLICFPKTFKTFSLPKVKRAFQLNYTNIFEYLKIFKEIQFWAGYISAKLASFRR